MTNKYLIVFYKSISIIRSTNPYIAFAACSPITIDINTCDGQLACLLILLLISSSEKIPLNLLESRFTGSYIKCMLKEREIKK